MHKKLKNYTLVICLVVVLFLSLENGLHLRRWHSLPLCRELSSQSLPSIVGGMPDVERRRKEETGSRVIPRRERP